jgi:Tfp pilus assembly protein PilN
MSVRVNLLPQEALQRHAAARQKVLAGLGGAVLVLALGATIFWQDGRIDAAETQLAEERAVLASLQGEVLRLDEFSSLAVHAEATNGRIRDALAGEVSMAGILQDVAAVMPSDAEFETLTLVVAPAEAGPGETVPTIGTLTATGRSATAHAPGGERLLLEFDKVAAFHEPFLTNSTLEVVEDPYTVFGLEAQLGPEVLTGRYADGIPEVLR